LFSVVFRYQLIGQNVVSNTENHRTRRIEVRPDDQINVKKGDMIGFYLPKGIKGGITFDKCVAQYTFGDFGNQKVIKDKVKTSAEWKIGDVYDIKNDNIKCKIISLRAYVM
jgi:hypothetical protein